MSAGRWAALLAELDALNQSAARVLQRTRFTALLLAATRRFLWTPAMVLGGWVILQVLSRLFESDFMRGGWLPWLIAALATFVIRVVQQSWSSRAGKIDRAHALGEWDLQLGLADRLIAADDFLLHQNRSAFMEAAIEDAAISIERTRQAHLQFEPPRERLSTFTMPLLAAALLLLTGSLAGDWHSQVITPSVEVNLEPAASRVQVEKFPETDSPAHENQRFENPSEKQAPTTETAAVAETRAYAAELEEKSKESEGKTGNGRSAAAESSTGAGSSQGTPSQQGQISKPGKEKTKAKQKPAAQQKPHKQEDTPKKDEEQESGATAGRGSSRGSNRNPASSEWSSKDHVNTPDDDNLEDEEEAEDEEEEQEARGGMQPSLRDRRPPVSRDLMIGFGNQPSPDANGRGGPSQPKKSRGTASLVLGVPIPDRIKGQPNAGKTKITQERVQPKSEAGVALDAENRQARVAPGSALQRQELEPWMRSLVRNYFLAQRQQVKKP